MALSLDYFNKIVAVTSPTTDVDAQTLHDFIEDEMASPVGLVSDGADTSFFGDILKPEGKIEDANNPGVFSQIILVLNSEWQIQFWQNSGYTRIFGGKIVGGLNGEAMKATGAAGDITVLESPVDGVTVASGSSLVAQDVRDAMKLSPTAGAPDAGSVDQHLDDLITNVAVLPTPAEVKAEMVSVMETDTHAEPTAAPGATSSYRDAIMWLKTLFRNKLTQTSALTSLRNDTDSADVSTSIVSDDGSTFTRDKHS